MQEDTLNHYKSSQIAVAMKLAELAGNRHIHSQQTDTFRQEWATNYCIVK